MPRGTPAAGTLSARRRAMGKLKATLEREGRSQAWLVRELRKIGFTTSQPSMSNYLHGYARISRPMLSAACVLACGGATGGDLLRDGILASVGDETLLLQPGK